MPFSNSVRWILNIAITMLIFELLMKPKTGQCSAMHMQAISLLGLQVVPVMGTLVINGIAAYQRRK